jgi:lipooligosaccharide transport system permease protein
MVTTLLAARLNRAGAPPVVPGRVAAVVNRNIGALRSGPAYWVVLASGFFEPLLYLLSIGVGVGALIGDITLPGGRTLSYAQFVAPAMLAASAMSGALAETTLNFFHKFKYGKIYEAMLTTPVRPMEIALGELTWAMMRGATYTAIFLGVMVALDLTTIGWALLAFPATLLVGIAFGAAGMAISTLMRGWQDFDLVTTGQMALFLFSGTFSPTHDYPAGFQLLVEATPLYHSVELLRGLTTGQLTLGLTGHTVYLLAMTAAGLTFAGRRLAKLLCE